MSLHLIYLSEEPPTPPDHIMLLPDSCPKLSSVYFSVVDVRVRGVRFLASVCISLTCPVRPARPAPNVAALFSGIYLLILCARFVSRSGRASCSKFCLICARRSGPKTIATWRRWSSVDLETGACCRQVYRPVRAWKFKRTFRTMSIAA